MKGMSVGPPGIKRLTVMPVPSSSADHTADIDSSIALGWRTALRPETGRQKKLGCTLAA
jgi:hypothetical protein